MYTFTRKQAADELGISTRSVDRYIKSGKLRSKKDGKIVYVHAQDIENIKGGTSSKQEVITAIPKKKESEPEKVNVKEVVVETQEIEVKTKIDPTVLDSVYFDMKQEIEKKDQVIQDLSMRVGRAEELVKNSVSLVDFKKSQFLLEESRTHLSTEIEDLHNERDKLESNLKFEKKTNIVLIAILVLVLLVLVFVFVQQI